MLLLAQSFIVDGFRRRPPSLAVLWAFVVSPTFHLCHTTPDTEGLPRREGVAAAFRNDRTPLANQFGLPNLSIPRQPTFAVRVEEQ